MLNKGVHLHQTSDAPEDRRVCPLYRQRLTPKGQLAPTMAQAAFQAKRLVGYRQPPSDRQDAEVPPSTGLAYESDVQEHGQGRGWQGGRQEPARCGGRIL